MEIGGAQISLWDLGGQKQLREYWANYFSKTSALIYVIDAADSDRLKEAGQELETLLKEDELLNVPLLVFANKQDLVHALGPDEIVESLGLTKISDRQWMIVACSALNKDGLNDGFDWVMSVLQKK